MDDIDQGVVSGFILVSGASIRVESDWECCVLSTGCEGKLVPVVSTGWGQLFSVSEKKL